MTRAVLTVAAGIGVGLAVAHLDRLADAWRHRPRTPTERNHR